MEAPITRHRRIHLAPEVGPAAGGQGADDLGHAQAQGHGHAGHQDPAPHRAGRPAVGVRDGEGPRDAREAADDGEADRRVGHQREVCATWAPPQCHSYRGPERM